MKKIILLFMLVIMTANLNRLNAKTVYGWCGNSTELPDGASRDDIILASEILNLLCDMDEVEEIEDPEMP